MKKTLVNYISFKFFMAGMRNGRNATAFSTHLAEMRKNINEVVKIDSNCIYICNKRYKPDELDLSEECINSISESKKAKEIIKNSYFEGYFRALQVIGKEYFN